MNVCEAATRLQIFVSTILFATNAAIADPRPVVVEQNQAVVQVNGVVCSFCAYGAEKSLAELDCVDKTQFGDGVLIDIDTHQITLAVRPGQKIPFRDIYQRIKKAGYDPVTLYVRSEGNLARSGETLFLTDSNTGQVFSIIGGKIAGVADDATVRVQASLAASQISDPSGSGVIEVTIDRLIADSNSAPEDG